MNPGELNRIITIQTLVVTEVDGHSTESWSLAETVRAKVEQVDGSRYLKEEELIDKQVFKIICWDNNYADNMRIGYGLLNLFPIKPITKNPGTSALNELVIIAATKGSTVLITTLLNPPTLFTATVISDTQIDLAWTNNALGQAVAIERSLNGNTFTEIFRTSAGVVAYSNTGLTTLTRYYYRIRAFSGTNYSLYTSVEDATTTGVAVDPVPATVRDVSKTIWYASDSHVVKDANNFVYKWEDNNGVAANDLIQATGTSQPLWSATGVLFDGIDNQIKTAAIAALDQPEFIYIVVKQVTWTNADYIFDGGSLNVGRLQQTGSTPQLKIYAGTDSAANSNLAVNTWGIVRVLFNGANSKLQVNNTAAITGDFGASNMGGFSLGARGTVGNYGNIEVKEVILRNVDDTGVDETAIYNYLATKYGFPTI